MKEIKQIESIIKALDVQKQYEKATEFLKAKGIVNPFYDGIYENHLDLEERINKFQRDYSGSPLVIFALSLPKNYKSYIHNEDGEKIEIPNPISQEKAYTEGKTNRITNFYDNNHLVSIAEKTGLKIESFEFGNTIIHLSILYDDMKPKEIKTELKEVKAEIQPEPLPENTEIENIINEVLSLPEPEEKPKSKLKNKGDK